MKKLISLLLTLALAISMTAVAAPSMIKADAAADYMCIGYVYQGHYKNASDVEVIDLTKLTHVNYAFALVNDETYIPELQETEILNLVREKKERENPDLKLMLSIGGWGDKGFCYAAQNDASREKFAQTCLDLINEYGFDGIDIDWEYPGGAWGEIDTLGESVDRANYTLLCQAIRNKIGPNKLLSIAGGASQSGGVECSAMSNILDYVNLMTYDYGAYNNSDFDSTKNYANTWVNAGFPKNRINIGVPFYGRQGENWPAYSEIVNYKSQGGTLTTGSSESYLTYNGNKISFDSPEMIRNKMLWIKQNGFSGGMTWELSQDLNNDLLNVMWSNLNGDGTYQSPYMPIPGIAVQTLKLNAVTCSATGSSEYGKAVTWTADITGGTAPIQYKFDVVKNGTVIVSGSYGSSAALTYTPDSVGSYSVNVSVKDANTTVTGSSAVLTVTEPYIPMSVTVSANAESPVTVGKTIVWTAAVSDGLGAYSYSFDVYKDSKKISTGKYGASASFNYKVAEKGSYYIVVSVKDSTGEVVSAQSDAVVAVNPLSMTSFSAQKNGSSATFTAAAEGGMPAYKYSFYVVKDGQVIKSEAYTMNSSFTFDAPASGTYQCNVYVDDFAGTRVSASIMVSF